MAEATRAGALVELLQQIFDRRDIRITFLPPFMFVFSGKGKCYI